MFAVHPTGSQSNTYSSANTQRLPTIHKDEEHQKHYTRQMHTWQSRCPGVQEGSFLEVQQKWLWAKKGHFGNLGKWKPELKPADFW